MVKSLCGFYTGKTTKHVKEGEPFGRADSEDDPNSHYTKVQGEYGNCKLHTDQAVSEGGCCG